MPTYDYLCDACGHAFEHYQSMTSRILRTCPDCKKKKLRRLIGSGAGVIFKGSGFYETDYKRKSGAPAASGPAASENAESSSESASGDKPDSPEKPAKEPAKKPAAKTGSDSSGSDADS